MDLKLEHCCFFGDLKIGSLIFSHLHLMKDLIQIVASAIILTVNYILRSPYYHPSRFTAFTFSTIFLSLSFISIIFTISLLIGLHQHKPEFVKIFLLCGWVSTVICFIISIILICKHGIFILLFPVLAFQALYIYFLLVIKNYYSKMDNSEMKIAIISPPAEPVVEYKNYFKFEHVIL